MATNAQMLRAGLAFVSNTFALMYAVMIFDDIFRPLLRWYYSFQYTATPPINPGIVSWFFPVYYGMLLCMLLALVYCLLSMAVNKVTYPYGG